MLDYASLHTTGKGCFEYRFSAGGSEEGFEYQTPTIGEIGETLRIPHIAWALIGLLRTGLVQRLWDNGSPLPISEIQYTPEFFNLLQGPGIYRVSDIDIEEIPSLKGPCLTDYFTENSNRSFREVCSLLGAMIGILDVAAIPKDPEGWFMKRKSEPEDNKENTKKPKLKLTERIAKIGSMSSYFVEEGLPFSRDMGILQSSGDLRHYYRIYPRPGLRLALPYNRSIRGLNVPMQAILDVPAIAEVYKRWHQNTVEIRDRVNACISRQWVNERYKIGTKEIFEAYARLHEATHKMGL